MKTVRYIGTADIKGFKSADFTKFGLTHGPIEFHKGNQFERNVPDSVAAFLLAQGDFALEDDSTFADLYVGGGQTGQKVFSARLETNVSTAISVVLPGLAASYTVEEGSPPLVVDFGGYFWNDTVLKKASVKLQRRLNGGAWVDCDEVGYSAGAANALGNGWKTFDPLPALVPGNYDFQCLLVAHFGSASGAPVNGNATVSGNATVPFRMIGRLA